MTAQWNGWIEGILFLALILSLVWHYLSTKDKKTVDKVVPMDVRRDLDVGSDIVLGLMKSPWFAAEASAGKVELLDVVRKLEETHLSALSAQGLAAFGKDLSDLTGIEHATLLAWIEKQMGRYGSDQPPRDIEAALEKAQAKKAGLRDATVLAARHLDEVLDQATQAPEATTSS